MENEKIKCAHVSLEEAAMDSVCTVECPYCGCEREVEPDAHYACECEECEKTYRVVGAC